MARPLRLWCTGSKVRAQLLKQWKGLPRPLTRIFSGGTSGPQHQALKHFPARKAAHREAAFACALGAHPPQSGCYAFTQRCTIGLPAQAQEQILGSLLEDFAWYLFDGCHPLQGRLSRGGPC
ncbi:hypothetical protein CVIRNUC_002204 [Coccomyxa viridis]|uniref:Uncharacterized protein n=1 Tax=Coccomyxa viridis TaxID=1274662 RepID=A0AAV1HX04_9CHLO|nr:hypothetical protein CVIRNUC_002204 [Coccomyxa viridis]